MAHIVNGILSQDVPHPIRVAVDGVDAAGKTTLADELAGYLIQQGRSVIRASIDGFHKPRADRLRRGPDSPDGYYLDSFNLPVLRTVLLEPLGPSGTRRFRPKVFDFRTDTPVEEPLEEAPLDAVLVFDGVFLLRPELRDCWEFSIFVRADFSVTLDRALSRDVALFGSREAVLRRYTDRYIPGQKLYLEQEQPERLATVVLDNNDPSRPLIVTGL